MSRVDHIAGQTFHGRKGGIANRFTYSIDYVLCDMDTGTGPSLFSRNRGNLMSVQDRDHGGAPGQGRGVAWLHAVLAAQGIVADRVQLLAQPRVLGHVFNPVSFWLCWSGAGLIAVVAEVTNTMGDRHSYLCRHADGRGIGPSDVLTAQKLLHVSPFQPVAGGYQFRFDIRPDRIGIWIDFSAGAEGVYATLTGARVPLTNGGIIRACLRRPFGSRRVLALIHWQAVKLAVRGAKFRRRPKPPLDEVS